MAIPTIDEVAKNLILPSPSEDDEVLIESKIRAAVAYAERMQHLPIGYYTENGDEMTENTKNAVIMLASHFFESRDGSTGGFFGDSVGAGNAALETADKLLLLDREWVL